MVDKKGKVMTNKITFNYDKQLFDWGNSKIYYFLCDNYMLHDVKITLLNKEHIILKKQNVVGGTTGKDYINIYNSIGETNIPICTIPLSHISELETL